jgi:hypothetical protein
VKKINKNTISEEKKMNKRGLNTIPGSDDQSHQRTYRNFYSVYYVFAPVSEHKGDRTEYQLIFGSITSVQTLKMNTKIK